MTDDIDIHQLLAARHQIAHIWGIEDVQQIRPDLSDERSWKVLQDVDRYLDSELGITWLTLEATADYLFPTPDESGHPLSMTGGGHE